MKVYRNYKEIKRRESMGRRFSLTGLGVLFLGLLISFVPTWLPPTEPIQPGLMGLLQQYWSWLSFAALLAGFLSASVGSYYINRYAARRWPGSRFVERPDEVVERSMKGFDDKYVYFAQSLPANYVLAGPNGLTILAVRSDKGRVIVDGDRWREPFSLTRIFTVFAREGVGNPSKDLDEQKARLRNLLAGANDETSDGDTSAVNLAEVPIEGAALFLNQSVQLQVNNSTIPVLRADQLKDFVRKQVKDVKLPNATQRALIELLVSNATYQDEE